MPQIVSKPSLREAFETLESITELTLVCEWSVSANLARLAHPDAFAPPRPFETPCWPVVTPS